MLNVVQHILLIFHFVELWPVCDRTIESRSNAERVALKLLIHKKIMFPVSMGTCRLGLKCKWNPPCV